MCPGPRDGSQALHRLLTLPRGWPRGQELPPSRLRVPGGAKVKTGPLEAQTGRRVAGRICPPRPPQAHFPLGPPVGQGLWHRVPRAEPGRNQGFVSADERGGPLRDPVRAARWHHGPRRHLHQPRPGRHRPGGAGTTVSRPWIPAPSPPPLPGNTSSLCSETTGQPEPKSLTRSRPGHPWSPGPAQTCWLPLVCP